MLDTHAFDVGVGMFAMRFSFSQIKVFVVLSLSIVVKKISRRFSSAFILSWMLRVSAVCFLPWSFHKPKFEVFWNSPHEYFHAIFIYSSLNPIQTSHEQLTSEKYTLPDAFYVWDKLNNEASTKTLQESVNAAFFTHEFFPHLYIFLKRIRGIRVNFFLISTYGKSLGKDNFIQLSHTRRNWLLLFLLLIEFPSSANICCIDWTIRR